MVRRRQRSKRRRLELALSRDDEPPDPISLTLAIVGTVVGVVGTTIGSVSAYQNAQSQAALQRSNAMAAERDAQWARQQAAYNENIIRQRNERLRGQQTAAIGASGFSFEGTPMDLLEETAINSEMEALTERRQGEFSAQSSLFQAAGHRYQANATEAAGRTQLTSGLISATGQLIGGVGGAIGQHQQMKQQKSYIAAQNNANAYRGGVF